MNARIAKELDGILEFLQRHGCEIIPVTNTDEILRFKGKQTGVIYATGNTSGRYVIDMLYCYRHNKKWTGAPVSTGRKSDYKKFKAVLLQRDGDRCFYCNLPLGEDISLEHLIPLTAQGPNLLSNMALAHENCNKQQGHKPLFEKVRFAVELQLLLG